jgi:hypothetical protein
MGQEAKAPDICRICRTWTFQPADAIGVGQSTLAGATWVGFVDAEHCHIMAGISDNPAVDGHCACLSGIMARGMS